MKKSILAVVVLLLAVATLPIVGNSYMKQTIDEGLQKLKSQGLHTKIDTSTSSYLNSSRHFEFLLKDSKNFVKYFNKYSGKQMLTYVNTMLDGVMVGADVTYSNLPFAKALEIEVYPLSLSSKMKNALQESDEKFAEYIQKFLQSKGILYHVDYNLLNSDFKGYIKDIDEKHKLKGGAEVALFLHKATFRGNGPLIAPNSLKTKLKELHLDAKKTISLELKNFSSLSNFESENAYVSSTNIEDIQISLKGMKQGLNASIKKFRASASSKEGGDIINLNSKTSLESLNIDSNILQVKLKKFNFDVAFNNLDKKLIENLQLLSEKSDFLSEKLYQQKWQNLLMNLFSRGLEVNVADFSVKDIFTKSRGDLKGFDMKGKVIVKEDPLLKSKIKISPLLAISDVDVLTNIRISKKIMDNLIREYGKFTPLMKYAKEDGDDLLFNMKFIDSKAILNGKTFYQK